MKEKRILTILISIFLVMSLLPASVYAATGSEDISYYDTDGSVKTVAAGQYKEVTSSVASWSSDDKSWYVVSGDVTISNLVKVKGSVNLILCDDATLTTKKGIKVEDKDSLTIYAQSAENKGKLVTTGEKFQAGIGGSDCEYGGKDCGTVTINGGNIDATGGKNGAGIGGGWNGDGGTININGGVIRSVAGQLAAGIGAGRYGNGGTVNITGGTIVLAKGGEKDSDNSSGAGIGGGQGQEDGKYGGGYGGTINITGGVIETAQGGYSGAGIGGGVWGDGGKITISKDAVIKNALGGKNGAGIGGGYKGKGGTITISGGVIESAKGGRRAAGIGGGYLGDGGTITIQSGRIGESVGGYDRDKESDEPSGGAGIGGGGKGDSGIITIKGDAYIKAASGNDNGAGIGGGGYLGNGNTISIEDDAYLDYVAGSIGGAGIGSGGGIDKAGKYSVTGGTINISGGYIDVLGSMRGAAIGGGDRASAGKITISGGEIKATSVNLGAGIGSGSAKEDAPKDNSGEIFITGGMVTARGGDGAGIGGGYKKSAKVVITGGTVTAKSDKGAAIGGGFARNGGTIEISGGSVEAFSKKGAGIGGGGGDDDETGGAGGNITISGADTIVTATSEGSGAGIGGGRCRPGGTITINDGTVTAEGGGYSAGIGGGANFNGEPGDGGAITINGGKIKATGNSAAGIGGGGGLYSKSSDSAIGGDGGTITINGGEIEATGSFGGAGIGGGGGVTADRVQPGAGGSGGTIEICGGNVTAIGTLDFVIDGSKPRLYAGGAGIGGGTGGSGGTIKISGGTVHASAIPHPSATDKECKSAAIGGGEGGSCGKLTISGGQVYANGKIVGIGCSDGVSASGNDGLQLTYSDDTMSDMSANASTYNCDVKIASGKTFSDDSGNLYTGTLSDQNKDAISGKTIVPIIPGTTEVVTYLDTDGTAKGPVTCEVIKAETTSLSDTGTTKGWYCAEDAASVGSLSVSGNVNLILRDKTSLSSGQTVIQGNSSLTLWEQSTGDDRGAWTVNGNPGIRGTGSITVNGGHIQIDSSSNQGISIDGLLTVNNGILNVNSQKSAIVVGSIAVSGGSVSANPTNVSDSYGITVRSGGEAVFSGGTVEASGKTALHFVDNDPSKLGLDGMMAYASKEAGAEPVVASSRANTCMNTGYAKIMTCQHAAQVYTDTGEGTHTISCKYCGDSDGKLYDHVYEDHVCVCGAQQPTHTITFHANNGTSDQKTQNVYDGEETALDANSFSWPDHFFTGWNTVKSPTAEKPGISYADEAKVTLTDDLALYGQWSLSSVNPPVVSMQPASDEFTYGKTETSPLFVVASAEEGCTLSYQWYRYTKANKSDLQPVPGAVDDTYKIPYGENAGTYFYYCSVKAVRTGDGSESVPTVSETAVVKIKQREVTVSVEDADAVTYDGEEHTGKTETAFTNILNGHTASITYTPAKGTAAATYSGSFGEDFAVVDGEGKDVTGNYSLTESQPGALTIGKASLTVKANDQNYTFNGQTQGEGDTVYDNPAQIAEKVSVDGLKGNDAITSVVLDGQGKEVGKYEIAVSNAAIGIDGAETGNYEISYVSGTLTISEDIPEYNVTVSTEGSGTASAVPSSGTAETKVTLTATPSTGWKFKEWQVISGGVEVEDNTFTIGTSDVEIKAVFEILQYQVTFVDDDGTVLKEAAAYDYGTPADQIEKPKDPTKAPTQEYTYIFAGWTPAVGEVTEDVVYRATYIATKDQYSVTFVDEDGTVLKETTVYDYGTPADQIVKPADPTKAPTEEYTYTFAGWEPEISEVTENVVYRATYSAVKNQYYVTFVDEDGTVLKEAAAYDFGTPADQIERPKDPEKGSTAEYTYTFSGWDPVVSEVTKDATYKATYTAEKNQYKVTFVDEDGTVLQSTNVVYGEKPEYTGETPKKPETDEYTYTFAGWTPEFKEVTGDATYTATYKEEKKIKYIAVEGSGEEYRQGSDGTLTFVFKRSEKDEETFLHFAGLKYDGRSLTRDREYTAKAGSVVIELQNSFLQTLDTGRHILTAQFNDGESEVDFTVIPAAEYRVTFDPNGHGIAPAEQLVSEGGKAIQPPAPAAQGYTFGGWYTEKECRNAFDFDQEITGDVTLYAKWTANSSNGGNNSGENGSSGTGGNTDLPKTNDSSHPVLWAALLAGSLMVIGIVLAALKRRKKYK